MAARRSTHDSLLALLLSSFLLVLSASLVTGGSVEEACTKTPYPEYCTTVLSPIPESKTADARGLAELAIRAAARIGAAVGAPARAALNGVTVRGAQWQCMDACVADVEEAVSHLDDKGTAGAMDEAKFDDVRDFIETAEKDSVSWNCDTCRDGLPAFANTGMLAKDNEFEKIMAVTAALIKQATGGAAPAPAPSSP